MQIANRPVDANNRVIHIKMPRNILKWVRWYAVSEGITIKQVIVRALKEEMKREKRMVAKYRIPKKKVRRKSATNDK